jgi:hypothetical protein
MISHCRRHQSKGDLTGCHKITFATLQKSHSYPYQGYQSNHNETVVISRTNQRTRPRPDHTRTGRNRERKKKSCCFSFVQSVRGTRSRSRPRKNKEGPSRERTKKEQKRRENTLLACSIIMFRGAGPLNLYTDASNLYRYLM